MKKKLLRLMLLPTILYALLAVASFTTAGAAHAATLQPQEIQPPSIGISRITCPKVLDTGPSVEMNTDWTNDGATNDLDCFEGTGSEYVKIYNVYDLYTGAYTFTWNWTDCNGGQHSSSKGPGTILSYVNASSNAYAGYEVMCKITYMALS